MASKSRPRWATCVAGTRISLATARAGFQPEVIDTYELGLKSQYAGGRVLTNIALFNICLLSFSNRGAFVRNALRHN